MADHSYPGQGMPNLLESSDSREDAPVNDVRPFNDFYNGVDKEPESPPERRVLDPVDSPNKITITDSDLSSIKMPWKREGKLAMQENMSDIKYGSIDSSIDTQRLKRDLLKQNLEEGEMFLGDEKLRTSALLTDKSKPLCGFCTADERREKREAARPAKPDKEDLSFRVCDTTEDEEEKSNPIYRRPEDVIRGNLNKKYLTSRTYYNVKVVNDIIYMSALISSRCSRII